MNSDILVRWNTPKDIPKQPEPESPRQKHDVRFNLPEIKFSQDESILSWMSSHDTGVFSAQESAKRDDDSGRLSPNDAKTNRVDSVATNVLNSQLERTGTILRQKKQARQERRALKQSGDYLGVQGINPATGRLDVETPTGSDESRQSHETTFPVAQRPTDAIDSSPLDKALDKEEKKRLLHAHQEELRRMNQDKQQAEDLNNQIMWRKHTKAWSAINDPDAPELDEQPSPSGPLLSSKN